MMEKYIRGLKIQKVTCTVQLSLFLSCDLFEDDNFLLVVFFFGLWWINSCVFVGNGESNGCMPVMLLHTSLCLF